MNWDGFLVRKNERNDMVERLRTTVEWRLSDGLSSGSRKMGFFVSYILFVHNKSLAELNRGAYFRDEKHQTHRLATKKKKNLFHKSTQQCCVVISHEGTKPCCSHTSKWLPIFVDI